MTTQELFEEFKTHMEESNRISSEFLNLIKNEQQRNIKDDEFLTAKDVDRILNIQEGRASNIIGQIYKTYKPALRPKGQILKSLFFKAYGGEK